MKAPVWPQKANQLRRVDGVRRRLKNELKVVDQMAALLSVPTAGRPVMSVLSDIEYMINELPGYSPTFMELRNVKTEKCTSASSKAAQSWSAQREEAPLGELVDGS